MVRVVWPTLALALTLGIAAVADAQAPPAVRVDLGEGIPDSLTGSITIPFFGTSVGKPRPSTTVSGRVTAIVSSSW